MNEIGTDPAAFEALYREHLPFVRSFVARRVHDPHTAADLTADIFVAVIESAHRYRPAARPPVARLAGVARNVVAGHQRSRARELRAVSRLRSRALLDDAAVERIAQRIDAERASRDLNLSQDALPAGRRAVVELVAVDGLSLAEAAAGSPSRRSPPRPRWAPSCFSPDRGRRPPTRCRRATPGW